MTERPDTPAAPHTGASRPSRPTHQTIFHQIYAQLTGSLTIIVHLLIYNNAMLAVATSLPHPITELTTHLTIRSLIETGVIPIVSLATAYLSATRIFGQVNRCARKRLIQIPTFSQCTQDVYPVLAMFVAACVSLRIVGALGAREAYVWGLRLVACCFVEASFLFGLLAVCARLFPKFADVQTVVLDGLDADEFV